ncbi:MAG: sulfate transporter CysZ [Gammaproteobacteria bacterium]|nr:sulfate transporter CysZ [Gammaproteobacteria bacterium]
MTVARRSTLALGASCFVDGAKLARSKPLRRFVWAPLLASLVCVALLLGVGYTWVADASGWVVAATPAWLDWLGHLVAALLYVLGLIVAGWLVGLIAVLVASPFLGALSAGAEREQFGTSPSHAPSVAAAVSDALRREARKLRYHLPRLIGLFVLTLIPVVNVGAPFFWFVFAAWMLAVQFVDYAAENRGLDFAETLAVLRANRAAALGFGAVAGALLAIPFAALVVIPAAVCGGALLWRRLDAGGTERRGGIGQLRGHREARGRERPLERPKEARDTPGQADDDANV